MMFAGVGVVVRWRWLAVRSAVMSWARWWARVRRRRGIFAVRSESSPGWCWVSRTIGAVGAHNPGETIALPGWVTYRSPAGEVQMTVPFTLAVPANVPAGEAPPAPADAPPPEVAAPAGN